jgi:2-methylcitrate dehydratase PrpD
MTTPLFVLARFARNLKYEDLPAEVVESIKDRAMDILGICVAAREADAPRAVRSLIDEWGGPAESTLIGEATARPAVSAALYNGTCAHSLDFDDTHLPSVVHPSAMLVPAALAEAEARHTDGRALITALAAAYEICTRLSMAQYNEESGNSIMFERGLHASAILGAVAGAAACARLRGLDEAGIANAMAIACSMGAGIIEANRTGGTVKRVHGGWAAHASICAAGLAAHGVSGPPTVFEGRFGLFQAYCGETWNPDELTAELGTRWDVPGIFYKPYSCNHFTHAFVDAAIALKARGVVADDVVSLSLGTAAASWRTIGDPIEEKRNPRTPYHAQFSAPFVFATALVGGSGLGVTMTDFTDATLADPERRRLASVTDVVADDECSRIFPHQFAGVARVTLRDGSELEERVMVNRGGPQHPLSRADLTTKLEINVGERAARIAAAVATLEHARGTRQLLLACAS